MKSPKNVNTHSKQPKYTNFSDRGGYVCVCVYKETC